VLNFVSTKSLEDHIAIELAIPLIMQTHLSIWFEVAIVAFGILAFVAGKAIDARLERAHPERYREIWEDDPRLIQLRRFRRYLYSSDDTDDPVIFRWKILGRVGDCGMTASIALAMLTIIISH